MNKSTNISYLTKEYESFYVELLESFDRTKITSILSDLFICSIVAIKEPRCPINLIDLFSFIKDTYKNVLFLDKAFFRKNSKKLNLIYNRITILTKNVDLNIFEKLFGSVLEKHINRKTTGTYYTPDDTTKFICWNSIIISILNKMSHHSLTKVYNNVNISNNVEFVDKKLTFEEKIKILKKNLSTTEIDEIIDIIKNLRIIDPTCGSGAFIISAYECIEYLNKTLLENKLNSKYYYKNLYGVDILDDAIILCKTRLILKTIISDTYSSSLEGVLKNNIICEDALIGSDFKVIGSDGLDWRKLGYFDCVVGNPPYVEVKDKNLYKHFVSQKCGNLYAYSIERACNISSNSSIVSFVVPLSLIATPRMDNVRKYLEEKSNIVYYCTFADRPGCLFSGVHQRLSIFFANIGNEECRRFTSSYKFWYRDERRYLFKSLDFIENNHASLPKIGTTIENSIFVKNRICSTSIFDIEKEDGKFPLYVSSRIGFWAKAFVTKPTTKEVTEIFFETDEKRKIAYCFINSSLFYYLWVLTSDCWHVTKSDLKNIKFNFETLSERQINKLKRISKELIDDLEKNKVRINTKQTEYEYKHKYSKKIIDKIDDVFCPNIGLDPNETEFIKSYTLKYRLNKLEESEESL